MNFVAVIIDDRPSSHLDNIILEHKKFLPEDWDIIHIKDKSINSLKDYNKILVSKEFWESMPEKVLIFQHDSMLLRKGIEDFLDYDYIGAPILDTGCFNGGLSLRSRDMMLKVIEKIPYVMEPNPYRILHEDMYFSAGIRELGGKLPDVETASLFSVETIFCLGSIGYHAIDKHLSPEQCNLIRTQYNEN